MSILVLYGSETGTSESFADTIEFESKKFNLNITSINLEDFDNSLLLSCNIAIIIISTYGNGEPTSIIIYINRNITKIL